MAEMTSNSEIPGEHLEELEPVRHSWERRLFDFGPLLVLVQLNIAGIALIVAAIYQTVHPNPQLISWAISWVYLGVMITLLIESIVFRRFLHKIPMSFQQLWDRGALNRYARREEDREEVDRFFTQFDDHLNHRRRILVGIAFAGLGLYFLVRTGHIPFVLNAWSRDTDLTTKLLITLFNTFVLFIPALIVGYALGLAAWKSTLTGYYVHRFSKQFDLVIQPRHPDKSGGLKPLGDLILAMAMILIVASLALSLLLVLASAIDFVETMIFTRIFLGLVLILSLIAFFLPLASAHQRMLAAKEKLEALLTDIARKIDELERSTQDHFREMDHQDRNRTFEEIDSLTRLYERNTHVPTWPFDRDIFLKFATPQIISLLSLLGIAEQLIQTFRSIIQSIGGG